MRTHRVSTWLSAAELRRLRVAARGRPLSAYIREAVLGAGANAEKDADEWWEALSQGRREQIHRWVASGDRSHVRPAVTGETPLPVFADEGAP